MQNFSLNGNWAFYYEPEQFIPGKSQLPHRALFTGKMVVPGYWDDHYDLYDEEDFFSLRARFNPDYRKPHFPMGHTLLPHSCSSFLIGTGFYRRFVNYDFPKGSKVVLNVGPAMWGCAVFCNGQLAGHATGYSVNTDFDLTKYLRPNEDNELIIAVCNVNDDGGAFCRVDGSHAGTNYGTRPGQHRGLAAQGYQSERGGIGDGVTLKITDKARIADYFISFENEKLHWHANLDAPKSTKALTWSIWDDGNCLASDTVTCTANAVDFETDDILELWSDRSPKLYTFTLELKNGDGTLWDTVSWRWGARKVESSNTRLLVNGLPTYFRGVTEHCYFAETCNPHFDKAKYLRDLGQLRKCGFNFIRCHTWCPPEQFYDACDELGFFVQTELPSVYSLEEAAAIIKMIRRHACAVIFCEGNEKMMTDVVLNRMEKLVELVRTLAPGMLFNPQEAMRGVEYAFMPGRTITQEPMQHDAELLARINKFADVYGSLGGGFFSYEHDCFPGSTEVDRQHTIYGKPCLSHEIGILGGYLNFNLEARYAGTYIGQDMFQAARDYMQRKGIYQNWEKYYQHNSRFISAIRKQLVENLRSCSNITGYDYLGGIDTHWHLIGYPCGVLNEFYEEKFGEPIADVYRYNRETMLLCSALNNRNRFAGAPFEEDIRLSYFGAKPTAAGKLLWRFKKPDNTVIAEGTTTFDALPCGTISTVAHLKFNLPKIAKPFAGTLSVIANVNGEEVENHWEFYVFPADKANPANGVHVAGTLTEELLDAVAAGDSLLLTSGFPTTYYGEHFRPHCSGRTLGHSGTIINPHPVWKDFPHEGFGSWQFLNMMTDSTSIVYDDDMPEFSPLMELIPSFKLIRRKAMLAEFQVGKGRLILCGLVLNDQDPAANYLRSTLISYLNRKDFPAAPLWSPAALKERLGQHFGPAFDDVDIDEGGRPILM